jgi:adenine-specific DNA-methyltransferase
VRYIGNKTRLLGFIRRVIRARGIPHGRAIDPFTGTASVGRALKRWGFAVTASDIMHYGYVFARAYVEAEREPDFTALGAALALQKPTLRRVLTYLERIPDRPSFIHEHYSPGGATGAEHGRMYFTPANALRIDSARVRIEEWRCSGLIDDDGYYTLLAAIIEAADRIANTTGVYAAFVKSWQPNALRSFQLRVVRPVSSTGSGVDGSAGSAVDGSALSRAARGDAIDIVRAAGDFELLYLDPPYNARQYPGYYHIPELLATGWFAEPVETRGKTGLISDREKRSDWSSSRRCEAAFEELLATARCRHVVMSYNEEGLIRGETIERLMKQYGIRETYRRYERRYRRYRSDTDGVTRHYRGDTVAEYLYCVSR